MCEANAYLQHEGQEELFMESVDRVQPQPEGGFLLVNIVGSQKTFRAKLKLMNLVDHKIIFET